jgi:predicted transcriptional regulator of viral defense system
MEIAEKGIVRLNRDNITQYRKMLDAARKGELIKLRNGLYAHPMALADDLIDINAIVPDGILCLYSAWSYYNLTTQVPDAFYVAVERTRKIKLPTFPDITPVFQKKELLGVGKTYIEERGIRCAITDLERSVCDAVKYRNKIGIDVMTEIIDSYLRMSRRNLSLLTSYAKSLRVYSTLQPILQVKL